MSPTKLAFSVSYGWFNPLYHFIKILVKLKLLIAKCSFKNFINTAFLFQYSKPNCSNSRTLEFLQLRSWNTWCQAWDRLFIPISIFQPCIVYSMSCFITYVLCSRTRSRRSKPSTWSNSSTRWRRSKGSSSRLTTRCQLCRPTSATLLWTRSRRSVHVTIFLPRSWQLYGSYCIPKGCLKDIVFYTVL